MSSVRTVVLFSDKRNIFSSICFDLSFFYSPAFRRLPYSTMFCPERPGLFFRFYPKKPVYNFFHKKYRTGLSGVLGSLLLFRFATQLITGNLPEFSPPHKLRHCSPSAFYSDTLPCQPFCIAGQKKPLRIHYKNTHPDLFLCSFPASL